VYFEYTLDVNSSIAREKEISRGCKSIMERFSGVV